MRLVIAIKDKDGGGIDSYKRGDVLEACPDGWVWSAEELNNKDWLFVDSQLLKIEADALKSPYKAEPLPNEILPTRKFRIDLDKLAGKIKLDLSAAEAKNFSFTTEAAKAKAINIKALHIKQSIGNVI